MNKFCCIADDILTNCFERSLYMKLVSLADANGRCSISNDELAKQCGMSKRKIIETKRSLEKPREELNGNALIKITKQFGSDGGELANIFEINGGLWIPEFIWKLKELSIQEKCLLSKIVSIDQPEEHCSESNEYFTEFMGCSNAQLNRMLKNLRDKGYISTLSFDGRKRILVSSVKI